jgi:EthD domain
MIKFLIAGRRKRDDTQENFFYNWGIIHVALMLTTPIVFQTFRRYAQNYTVNNVSAGLLWHPLSPMSWDSLADHWLNSFEELARSLRSPDYRLRMQPHRFSDHQFVIEFTGHDTIFEQSGGASGGLKLIHFLKKRPELTQEEFARRWREEHGPNVVRAMRSLGILRKYVQSPQLLFDRSVFTGTLFERADVGHYAGMEEFWFNSYADLSNLANDRKAMDQIRASDSKLIAEQDTFAMVTMERVIYDDTVPGSESRKPAVVLQPDSLESVIDAQGYEGWNIPR